MWCGTWRSWCNGVVRGVQCGVVRSVVGVVRAVVWCGTFCSWCGTCCSVVWYVL